MKTIQTMLVACAILSLCGIAVAAEPESNDFAYKATEQFHAGKRGCSVRDIAGKWLFATSIGRQMLPDLPPDKDMTAIGTWIVKRNGSLSGTFDVTVQDTFFAPAIRYEGSVTVNRDCTGTVTFVTELGSTRTDTIAIVGRNEILGMSQDPFNLWAYQVRRVGYHGRKVR